MIELDNRIILKAVNFYVTDSKNEGFSQLERDILER